MQRSAPGVSIRQLYARYETRVAVHDLSMECVGGTVTALIGPSGCGKSTLMRCINRLHETMSGATMEGHVLIGDRDVTDRTVSPIMLRRTVGMVFQRPTPFPTLSVFENVAAGLTLYTDAPGESATPWKSARLAGSARRSKRTRAEVADGVEQALRRAALWPDVRDRLHGSAMALSGGQQQRLCIARALAASPSVLLLDEPTSSLDPVGTQRIEELLYELRGSMTIIVVTHNLQQAARISDSTAFLLEGALVELSSTRLLFTTPRDPRTEWYITGRFG